MTPSARSRACTAPLRSFLSGRLAHSRLAAQRQFNHGGSSLPAPLRLEPRVSASPRVQRAGPGRALGARLTIELSMPRDTRGIRRVRRSSLPFDRRDRSRIYGARLEPVLRRATPPAAACAAHSAPSQRRLTLRERLSSPLPLSAFPVSGSSCRIHASSEFHFSFPLKVFRVDIRWHSVTFRIIASFDFMIFVLFDRFVDHFFCVAWIRNGFFGGR